MEIVWDLFFFFETQSTVLLLVGLAVHISAHWQWQMPDTYLEITDLFFYPVALPRYII